MRYFKSRQFIVGGFAGAVLVLTFLASCGGGGAIAQAVATALGIEYDNGDSGIAADNVQDAIDELAGRGDTNTGAIAGLTTRVGDVEAGVGALDITVDDHDGRIDALETTSSDHETRVGTLETDSTDHGNRITTLENATITAANVTYSNTTSGLTATDAQAAIDEIVSTASGGSTFIRWGNKNAPTGTTKLYDGIAMAPSDGKIFVMKGGDPGSSHSVSEYVQFVGTGNSSGDVPSGITIQKRIVACVCYSSKPTAVLWGTHTAPTGWSILYKGYMLSNGTDVICVDSDNFDATAANSGSETTRVMRQPRFSNTHDSTNYPTSRNIKACVVQKN